MATARTTRSSKSKPAPASSAASVEVVMDNPQEKKAVTRFDNSQDGAAMSTAYVNKAALAKIGNPSKIKITIEAA